MRSFMLFGVFMAFVGLAQPANAQTQGFEVQVTVTGHTGDVAGSSSEHFLTFSAPVGVPGVGLAPGMYIFRFIAPSVIQVLSEDRSIAYAMFFVTPAWRSEVTDDYAVSLRRVHSDAPARIATLFLPGASTGYELTYPKVEIAAVAEQVAMK
jgi:hypothetical protein